MTRSGLLLRMLRRASPPVIHHSTWPPSSDRLCTRDSPMMGSSSTSPMTRPSSNILQLQVRQRYHQPDERATVLAVQRIDLAVQFLAKTLDHPEPEARSAVERCR